MATKGKIPNTTKPNAGGDQPYSSGIYYGTVVSVEDEFGLDEGLIKVNIPRFDDKAVPFCKDIKPKSNRTSSTPLKRKQGANNLNSSDLVNQAQIDALSKRKRNTAAKETDNEACIEVPYAVPLLPKNLQIMPKEGEMCMVLVENVKMDQQNRYWIGPLLSDKSKLAYESSVTGGNLLTKNVVPVPPVSKNTKEDQTLKKRGDFTGGFPEKLDIAIMGRNNADIVLPTNRAKEDRINTSGEVLIRAGKFNFTKNKKLTLNTVNPGFLRIKVVNSEIEVNKKKNSDGSGVQPDQVSTKRPDTHSMLYSDYISLVSYKNSDGSIGVPTIKKINPLLENDTEIDAFHNALSPLIRGDVLVQFLKLLVNYVQNHNHPYPKLPATNANSKPEIEKFDLNSLLSPHIRIN